MSNKHHSVQFNRCHIDNLHVQGRSIHSGESLLRRRIKDFQVAMRTPMECMKFVYELKDIVENG